MQTLTRRRLLANTTAAALLSPSLARAASLAATMQDRAARFLGLLTAEERDTASLPLGGRTWQRWNYMTGSAVSPGLPLERMGAETADAALDLLSSGLSAEGMAKAERVMLLQDVLRDEMGKGAPHRNSRRFSLALFGTPSTEGAWAWRFEGHHLTLTYTLLGGEIVSVTPSSFSSDPNEVPSGPHQGLVALDAEERLGRRLFADLAPAAQRQALLQERSFGNVLAVAGREDRIPSRPRGLAVGDMAAAQRELVERLLAVYATDHLPGSLADAQRARLAQGDAEALRFGWAGDPARGSVYYRLHGETVLLEFATLRNQPQHHHTTRHDFARNLGVHVL